jgi:2-polyprenyl-3-methyl-5-hydroxy-6-metoxy-1,4-benzoquinol methylase
MVLRKVNSDYFSWAHDYFNRGYVENPRFWLRLGGAPFFKGLKVLDIGCGTGSLCVDIATKGAKKVIGIDIDELAVAFAKEHLTRFFPKLENRIAFRCCSISGINDNDFDIIVSKDTFEHILDLDRELMEMKRRLKPGGKMYVGFSPLYHSFRGDHGRTKTKIPWGHLLIPEKILLRSLKKNRKERITSIYDLGLNTLSLRQFFIRFKKSGFAVSHFCVNANTLGRGHEKAMLKIFSLVRRVPALEKYFSCNLYCILENR